MQRTLFLYLLVLFVSISSNSQENNIIVTKQSVVFKNIPFEDATPVIYLLSSVKKGEDIIIKGSFDKKIGELVFTPEFPLLSNVEYMAQFKNDIKYFSLQDKNLQSPVVTAIYPSSNKLPENLLRMYIQFSQPMKTINNLEHISLTNDKGEVIKGAIFNNVYELWNDEQTQLTIIFDPARVKTGLLAHESYGRALQPNKTYHLTIDHLQDIYGNKMKNAHTKTFIVESEDKRSPDISLWQIHKPKPKTHDTLKIDFTDAVDMMSLKNRIQVLDVNNQIVHGKIEITNTEKSWHFIPHHKWENGDYQLYINSRLADPSGNNLNGLFDHEFGDLKYDKEGKIIKLKIQIN